jgi:hypothetical protein
MNLFFHIDLYGRLLIGLWKYVLQFRVILRNRELKHPKMNLFYSGYFS